MRLRLLRSSTPSIAKTNAHITALQNAVASFRFSGAVFGLLVAVSVLLLGPSSAWAQTPAVSLAPVINTVAGTGVAGYSGDGGAAASAKLLAPYGVAVDGVGNFYIADVGNSRIRKVTPDGTITTVAGNGSCVIKDANGNCYSGDGGAATSAELGYPYGVAVDGSGNLYIADTGNSRIRKVTPDGTITTVAGNGSCAIKDANGNCYSGDGGAATSAELNQPFGVAVDGSGNLYIADLINNRIRVVCVVSSGAFCNGHIVGNIYTVAGNGIAGYSGDGGAATSAELNLPSGVAVDGVGNLYIADYMNNRIRQVTPNGIITTVAGDGYNAGGAGGIGGGYSGDGGPATSAELNVPYGVAADSVGNLYIADTLNRLIRKVAPGGIITTVAGGGAGCPGQTDPVGDGCIATSAVLDNAEGVAVDGAGNLYIASGGRIRKVSGTTAPVSFPATAIASASASQNVLLAINSSLTISSVSVPQSQGAVQEFTVGAIAGCVIDGVTTNTAGIVCTVPVTFQPGYPGLRQMPLVMQTSAGLFQFALQGTGTGPMVAFGPGIITTVAGTGTPGYNGDNIAATSAELKMPYGVAVDSAGNLYIADLSNNRIRKVTPSGIITVTGNGTPGYNGDNIAAVSAELSLPNGVAVDGAGNLYIADTNNSRIRKVTPDGTITTVAGNGTPGYNGDNIAATSAELYWPSGVAVDGAGTLYIADTINSRIRKVTPAGIITTVAGNGTSDYSGDSGAATSAELNWPVGVAVDGAGNLYIADTMNNRIRKVTPGGIITTVAGTGINGYSGDGGAATSAELFIAHRRRGGQCGQSLYSGHEK